MFKIYLFIYLFIYLLLVLALYCCTGFSLVAAIMDYSLDVVLRCLVVTSLLRSTGSRACRLQWLQHMAQKLQFLGSIVVAHRLSCCVACGIFQH